MVCGIGCEGLGGFATKPPGNRFPSLSAKPGADLTRSRSEHMAHGVILKLYFGTKASQEGVVPVRCFLIRFRPKCPLVELYLNFNIGVV